ncbi:hypothetical protein SUGI_0223530 [Cryptomeria japonica]|nr:hypothetical protein SUGI_0223530 [Cryptomeria japonica]
MQEQETWFESMASVMTKRATSPLQNEQSTISPPIPSPLSCLEGFSPRDSQIWDLQEWWSSGCVHLNPLNCDSQNGSTDGFIESNVLLPDNPAYSYPAQTREICETECLRNCSCTAFRYTEPAGPCQIWPGDLHNLRSTSKGPALFVRVANVSIFEPDPLFSSQRKTPPIVVSLSVSVSLLGVFFIALLISYVLRRRGHRSTSTEGCDDSSTTSLRMFSCAELKIATRNFKYKLGRGGFGSVFKGTLTDTTIVAVKKLEDSRIAEKQFRAEISSVGNIHHVNLIRLRGFCAQGSHRLLVYDCMPNGSLNSFLFKCNSEIQGKTLDWKTRNLDLSVQESSKYYFPAWAATEIQQGSMMNIVDKRIVNNACVEEVRRATLVSLLCIQNDENARPSMGQVVHMLEGITEAHEVALQMPSHMEDHEIDAGSTDSD